MAPTTNDVLEGVVWGDEDDHEWLHRLIGDWQLLADLSFADLALWVPSRQDGAAQWFGAAQARPTTGVSLFADDLVGVRPGANVAAALDRAVEASRILTVQADDVMVDVVPVRRGGRSIAVLTRHTPPGSARRRGRLEQTYLGMAQKLLEMVAQGNFPDGGGGGGRGGAPRVGDGVIALAADGRVDYASPNAVSALRRLGVEQTPLGWRLAKLLDDPSVDAVGAPEEATAVLAGRAPWNCELRRVDSAVTMRAVPLVVNQRRDGALLLLRDISELRRRDRQLMTKDATIREIHHRVKNNLQAVAALLRLQARRVTDEEATHALADAGRRVAMIADVHESLSEGFDDAVEFDAVVERGLATGIEVGRRADAEIDARLVGSFGVLASEDATSLAMIMGELVQNAVEHGLRGKSGSIRLSVDRDGDELTVDVSDSGVGMAPTSDPVAGRPGGRGGLGTQIVKTFVSDLGGTIEWLPADGGGTRVHFTAHLRPVGQMPRKPARTE